MTSCDIDRRSIGRSITHIRMRAKIYLQKELEPFGIGSGQYHFLLLLFKKDGCSQEDLTEMLMVDKATTTRAISKLELLGYIQRKKDPTDRRRYLVKLTDEGLDLKPKIREVLDKWTSILLEGFSMEEKEQVVDLLDRMEMNSEGLR